MGAAGVEGEGGRLTPEGNGEVPGLRVEEPGVVPTAEDEVAKRDAELPAADSWDGSGDGEGDAGVAAGDEDPEGSFSTRGSSV